MFSPLSDVPLFAGLTPDDCAAIEQRMQRCDFVPSSIAGPAARSAARRVDPLQGSLVSLFITRQAIGAFKYNANVYDFGTRNFTFDTDFLSPALLPPGTPMFRDVNTLTFRPILRPNQYLLSLQAEHLNASVLAEMMVECECPRDMTRLEHGE